MPTGCVLSAQIQSYLDAQVCLIERRQRQSTQDSLRGGTWRASIPFAIRQGSALCALYQYKKVARQRGNGIADSMPAGSGNLDVQLGRQRNSNLFGRGIQSHANHSLPKFPANREMNREYAGNAKDCCCPCRPTVLRASVLRELRNLRRSSHLYFGSILPCVLLAAAGVVRMPFPIGG